MLHSIRNKVGIIKIAAAFALTIASFPAYANIEGDLAPGDIGALNLPNQVQTEMTVITPKGYVNFTIGSNWSVLAAGSNESITVMAFQIPNKADENTEDSTNLSISLMQPESDVAKEALSRIGKQYGAAEVKEETRNGWAIYTSHAKQGETKYSIIDAKRNIADVIVAVRLAWPQLPGNDKEYNHEMDAGLNTLLASVSGTVGTYTRKETQVFRRPEATEQ